MFKLDSESAAEEQEDWAQRIGSASHSGHETSAKWRDHNLALYLALILALVYLVPLLLSLGDYRVTMDSGYHVSLAEWYAHHGSAWWDHINYGPGGRPNLQGPALHIAIAVVGSILGGSPWDFILANSILAIFQWCAALATLIFFTRRSAGDLAALLAVSLFCGAAFGSASFYVGVPSGWLFILTPWAIWFFLEDQIVAATIATSLCCYMHLGGFVTAPLGVACAALLKRRWKRLAQVGVATILLTAPYWIHVAANVSWLRMIHAHESFHYDLLLDLLTVSGFVWLIMRRRTETVLIAWLVTGLPWLLQDPDRFVLQEVLAGAAAAGVLLSDLLDRASSRRRRIAFATAIVVVATVFPIGSPGILGETAWALGYRYPRMLDWNKANALAEIIQRNHLQDRLLASYENSLGTAIAVFTPIRVERGHWVEVHAVRDPADDISAGDKIYVVPLNHDDPLLAALQKEGLVTVWGGQSDCAVLTLRRAPAESEITPVFDSTLISNARWLAANAVNDRMLDSERLDLPVIYSDGELLDRRRVLERQRFHAGRMEVVTLLYAYSLEPGSPRDAKALRGAALGFGELASFLSDGDAIGDISDSGHEQLLRDLRALAGSVTAHSESPIDSFAVRTSMLQLFEHYFQIDFPMADRFASKASPAPRVAAASSVATTYRRSR